MIFAQNLWALILEAAPWLVFGFLMAGLIKAWMPQDRMARLLGGGGLRPVITGALVGAPLPLCCCGVLPAAIGLRRGGASRQATVSFLVSTPETGVDSVALSYGLLGPFMAVVRPIAALFSAVVTGLLMVFVPSEDAQVDAAAPERTSCAASSCGCSASGAANQPIRPAQKTPAPADERAWTRTVNGLRYAFVDIFEDIAGWMVVGLLLAAATMTWVPPQTLSAYGSGIPAMLVMIAVGIPMYICATASTPVAAGLLLAGVSPGAALVFMLAGPATNIATLGVVRKELGGQAMVLYLIGIIGSSLVAGVATDYAVAALGIDISVQMAAEQELVPEWLAVGSAAVLAVLAVLALPPLLSRVRSLFRPGVGRSTEQA